MLKKYLRLLPFLFIILFSCKEDETQIREKPVRTVIVYMAADNNLSNDAIKNLEQIKDGYRKNGANLIVFIDTADENPKLLEIINNKTLVIKEYSEFDSVSADKIKEILLEIVNLYPSDNYDLVLWSHGSSWLPSGSALRSFGEDQGNQLNIAELANALPICFECILFDACLMGSVEVAYELRNKTNYLIATSTETIADGFPYEIIIPELLSENCSYSQIAQIYFDFYNNMKGGYRSATISLIKSSEMEELAAVTKKMIIKNINWISIIKISDIQRLDVYSEQYHFDFSDYISKLFPNIDKTEFIKQLQKTILFKANTPKFIDMYNINTYCGLSCYISRSERKDLNLFYKNLKWYNESGFYVLF